MKRKGFTLIELIVGIVILSMVMTISLSQIVNYKKIITQNEYRFHAQILIDSIVEEVQTDAVISEDAGGFGKLAEYVTKTKNFPHFYSYPHNLRSPQKKLVAGHEYFVSAEVEAFQMLSKNGANYSDHNHLLSAGNLPIYFKVKIIVSWDKGKNKLIAETLTVPTALTGR